MDFFLSRRFVFPGSKFPSLARSFTHLSDSRIFPRLVFLVQKSTIPSCEKYNNPHASTPAALILSLTCGMLGYESIAPGDSHDIEAATSAISTEDSTVLISARRAEK